MLPPSTTDIEGVRPQFEPTQEMRFSVVMYGGVSLAIYINGVAQELLRLVRATAPDVPTSDGPGRAWLREGGCRPGRLLGTELVYRRLGQMVRWGDDPDLDPQPDSPISTRFVVDVLAGSSAGGINAIYLSKALANEQDISGLRRLWIEEGDIGKLVNDKDSLVDTELELTKPPRSLLNSERMYWQLLSALRGMGRDPEGEPESRLVDELDCSITTTDLRGLTVPVDLLDRVVYERRHKFSFHFAYASSYCSGERRNDFVRRFDPFLAFAGRATAAFPFAFEPIALRDIDSVVQRPFFGDDYREHGSLTPEFERFFPDHAKAQQLEDPDHPGLLLHRAQAFADGGYLDNKPFSYATRRLWRRRADLPVDRRLIYVEPDPNAVGPRRHNPGDARPSGPVERVTTAKPDALQNSLLAAHFLPRYEPIREDLEDLLERNKEIQRIQDIAALVDRLAETPENLLPRLAPEDRARLTVAEMLADPVYGVRYVAYHRLKLAYVLDQLADLLTTLAGFDPGTDGSTAVRCLVQAWFDRRYSEQLAADVTQASFLLRFDLEYRLRRLNFLQDRIEHMLLLKDGETLRAYDILQWFLPPDELQLTSEAQGQLIETLRTIKLELNEIFVRLRKAGRNLRSEGSPLRAAVTSLGLTRTDLLTGILSGARGKAESIERARELLDTKGLAPAFAVTEAALEAALARPFERAREETNALLAGHPDDAPGAALARRAVRYFYDHYEDYDSVLFPITYGHVGEADQVEVIRVSPQDAPTLIDETKTERRKLAGSALGHFGGFFERAWRRNDLMWGRLDAAERIIESTLPPAQSMEEIDRLPEATSAQVARKRRYKQQRLVKDSLIHDAHLEIVKEEFSPAERTEVLDLVVDEIVAAAPGAGEDGRRLLDDVERNGAEAVRDALYARMQPEDILEYLRTTYSVDKSMNARETLRTVGRATRVTGMVLDGITHGSAIGGPARWITRVGRLLVEVVEAATPRTFKQLLWRYWLVLLAAIAVTLVVGGAVFGGDGVQRVGWIILILVALAKASIWVMEDMLRDRRVRLRVLVGAIAVAVIALAGVEVFVHAGDDVGSAAEWFWDRVR